MGKSKSTGFETEITALTKIKIEIDEPLLCNESCNHLKETDEYRYIVKICTLFDNVELKK